VTDPDQSLLDAFENGSVRPQVPELDHAGPTSAVRMRCSKGVDPANGLPRNRQCQQVNPFVSNRSEREGRLFATEGRTPFQE
jgi:hypothetical protein